MKRVTFYIDGFNFYFGLKRTKKMYSELADMVMLCESFLGIDSYRFKSVLPIYKDTIHLNRRLGK